MSVLFYSRLSPLKKKKEESDVLAEDEEKKGGGKRIRPRRPIWCGQIESDER